MSLSYDQSLGGKSFLITHRIIILQGANGGSESQSSTVATSNCTAFFVLLETYVHNRCKLLNMLRKRIGFDHENGYLAHQYLKKNGFYKSLCSNL